MNRFRYLLVGALILHLLSMVFDVGVYDSQTSLAIAPVLLGSLAAAGGAALSDITNRTNRSNAEYALKMQKELMNYEWKNFNSPKAQAASLAEVGLNPSVAYGQGGMRGIGFSGSAPELAQVSQSGTDIANNILALATAKKTESDIKKTGQETKNLEVENQAKQFELDLSKIFSVPEKYAGLTLAWKNVALASDQHNINEWINAKEKALSETQGTQRDILKKTLDNMDIQLRQENKQREEDIKLIQERQKTEKTSQSAYLASANASNAAASVSRENRRLQSALADIEEAGKTDKINSLISEYKSKGLLSDADAKDAQIRLGRLSSVEDKRSDYFFREVDNYLEWLKNKVSIFKSK